MNTFAMLLAEIRYRKLNFLLSVFAVTIAAALFVAGPVLVDGYARQTQVVLDESKQETADELARLGDQTRVLMRDIGFNLMIVHRDTNMSDFWAADYAANDMPQEYVDRLARDRRLTMVTHLVATLQQKITFNDRKVLLIGYLPETTQSHMRHKDPMGYNDQAGDGHPGLRVGRGKKKGDTGRSARAEVHRRRSPARKGQQGRHHPGHAPGRRPGAARQARPDQRNPGLGLPLRGAEPARHPQSNSPRSCPKRGSPSSTRSRSPGRSSGRWSRRSRRRSWPTWPPPVRRCRRPWSRSPA